MTLHDKDWFELISGVLESIINFLRDFSHE